VACVDVVSGWTTCWLIVKYAKELPNISYVYMRQPKPGMIERIAKQLGRVGEGMINLFDKVVNWAVGDKPADKKRLTSQMQGSGTNDGFERTGLVDKGSTRETLGPPAGTKPPRSCVCWQPQKIQLHSVLTRTR
jgi:hypothetical protein